MQNNSRNKLPFEWTGILKALADESRLRIIHALLKGEAPVNKLTALLDSKIYNVSRHLKVLEENGLVEKRKDGTNRIYRITEKLESRLSEGKRILDLGCCKFDFSSFND